MPYSAPYYGNAAYGAPYSAPYAGYGYPGYGNYLGRSSAAYNAYPGYGYGYRFGGYAGALRGPVPAPVAAGVPAYPAPTVPVPSKGLPYGYAPPATQKLPVY